MAVSPIMVQDYAGVTVASFTNSAMLDARSIDSVGKELYRLADELNKRKIILDFSDVKLLSSQALGVLITLQKKMAGIKGELSLCGLRKEIRTVFKITKLEKMFKFYPNDAAALKQYGIHVR